MTADACVEPVSLVVGVAGHRDLVAGEIPGLVDRVRQCLEEIQALCPHTPVAVLSSLADGGDLLVGKVARDLGVRLVAPLPMPRELFLRDFRGEQSRREFEELCEYANVFELPLIAGHSVATVAEDGAARDKQYAQAGVYVASHCQVLLALWDGRPSDDLGGTAQVVEYHFTDRMPDFLDDPGTAQRLLAEDENDLVLHIACSRDRPGGEPPPPLRPLHARWLTSQAEWPGKEKLPDRYRRIFARTDEFNRDALKHRAQIARDKTDLLSPADCPDLHANDRRVNQLFYTADWLANHYQRRLNLALRGTYLVAALMGLAFILYADLRGYDYMVYVFLLLFVIGYALYRFGERRHWHRKYLDYRVLAEALRVQFFWRIAGVAAGAGTAFAYANFLQKQDPELEWIRNAMRVASLRHRTRVGPGIAGGLDIAIRRWIGSPGRDGNGGQLRYYARKLAERTRVNRVSRSLAQICLWTGIAAALALALFQTTLGQGEYDALIVLMGILPLVAGVREAYAHKKADKELIRQYEFMYRIFGGAARQLTQTDSTDRKRDILKELGKAALDEHAQWIFMHRERAPEPGQP